LYDKARIMSALSENKEPMTTYVTCLFGLLDLLGTLGRGLDIGRRGDGLGRRGAEELVHVVEGSVVDVARVT
jgi:hypothetical protein